MGCRYGAAALGTSDFIMGEEGVHIGDTSCISMVQIAILLYGYRWSTEVDIAGVRGTGETLADD